MNRNLYLGLLVTEAMFCIAFTLIKVSFNGIFSTAMAFPFEQLGMALRALSLSGGFGNAAAIVIYIMVCISPAAVLLIIRKRRKLFPEDGLLVLLSISLFLILYLMINPGIISSFTAGTAGLTVGKAVLGCAVYSVICGYFILWIVRSFFQSDVNRLSKYMTTMLGVLGMVFIYMAFGSHLSSLLSSVEALRTGNAGNEQGLWVSYIILGFRYFADIFSYILDAAVILSALRLLEAMHTDRYSEESVIATERMSRYCAVTLYATVVLSITGNLVQIFLIRSLRTVNVTVSIPVFSIAFLLAALMFTRFVAENKRLKDENNAFI